MPKILVLNLGGTSTKIAIFEDTKRIEETNIHHPREVLQDYPTALGQIGYRKQVVLSWLSERGLSIDDFDCFALRGCSLDYATKGGTYHINDVAIQESKQKIAAIPNFYHGTQIVNLLAVELDDNRGLPIYLTDPPNVNELIPEAKIAGHPTFERIPIIHVLNAKTVGRKLMADLGKSYETSRLVICHMGAGVSVSAHLNGRIIDGNNCINGEGPMSPNRVGQLPLKQLIQRCFHTNLTEEEILKLVRQEGGIKAHLGTSDMRKVEKLVEEGDEKATLILKAFVWQIAKEIGGYTACLDGETDYIILTGGIAHSNMITKKIIEKIERFAPVLVFGGELESEGLALGALNALLGKIDVIEYENPDIEAVVS
ncbi:MAG: butyrate kinase [Enterococcus sp.]|jgi:butyrate kinase|uniref:butyrate kinase n=1 Tax=Enterococcus TaxID=1350 RepID=UPI000DF641E7|nr:MULTISPECIES: butyrate kinase [Enterococcus]AXG37263.1 butyrate kinase [Enterococcus gilvus]MDN6002353.1 butyrate kinase [Enterococcus sp.]MDN6217404.1 butyrate kinase [Enterococcus sp.]MDN6517742.1 butyrate kinase [Enterococcus sp.]MDN6560060.1 butyrate kinase [Enterococcus sp.]